MECIVVECSEGVVAVVVVVWCNVLECSGV